MLYLIAALRRALGLPPPHVHDWAWGETHVERATHWGEGLDALDPPVTFDVRYQCGRCRGCGAEKTRRVW